MKERERLHEYGFSSVEFSEMITIVYLATFGLVPIVITVYYFWNRNHLQDETFVKRVGSFVEGARLEEAEDVRTAVTLPLTFCIRSLSLCTFIVFKQDFFWGQIASSYAVTLASLIFI